VEPLELLELAFSDDVLNRAKRLNGLNDLNWLLLKINRAIYTIFLSRGERAFSVAGWGCRGFQVLDVGINIGLEFSDLVYWPFCHDREISGILWKDVGP
jgi:hypothetical protein